MSSNPRIPNRSIKSATTGRAGTKQSLKARPSLSSITNSAVKDPASRDEENEAPDNPALGKSASTVKRSTSPTKASISRHPVLGSLANVEPKAPSAASPGKKPKATTTSRTTHTPRSTRPVHYIQTQPRSGATGTAQKKRLSSIAGTKEDSSPTAEQTSPAMTRTQRPGLGARKSTQSDTIEQRLREMAIVSTMLNAAMADSGDDEVKEEYGQQVDMDLAMLKSKLEEARRVEGKESLRLQDAVATPEPHTAAGPAIEKASSPTDFTSSEEQKRKMQAKLTAINEQSLKVQELARDLSYGFASQPDSKILDYQNHAKQLKEAISSYTKELVAADPKIAYAEQRLQELSRIHNLQLEQVKETSAAEASEKVSRLLHDQLQKHKAQMETLREELNSEQYRGQEASVESQGLADKLVDLKNLLDDEKEKYLRLLQVTDHSNTSHQDELRSKDQKIDLLHNNLQDLRQETKEYTLRQEASFQNDLNTHKERIRELEFQADDVSQSHVQEVAKLQDVVEGLQDKVRQIHEAEQRTLEQQRLHLTQEHDERISHLRIKHEQVLQTEREDCRRKLEEMQNLRDKAFLELKELRNNHERIVDDYEKSLEENEAALEASKPILMEVTKLLSESRERCYKAEADFEAATAELAKQTELLTTKEKENADTSRRMDEVLAKLTATEVTVAMKEAELNSLCQQHSEQIQDIDDNFERRLNAVQADLEEKHDAWVSMMNDSQQQRALREEQAVMAAAELKVQEAVRALNKQKTDLEARVRVAEQKAIDHAVRAREAELRAESAAESAATKIARHAVRAREAEMKYEAVQRDLETARAYQTGKVNARNDTASSHGATSGEDVEATMIGDMGASIIGHMAGIQEQIKAIQITNERINEQHRRFRFSNGVSQRYMSESNRVSRASTPDGQEEM